MSFEDHILEKFKLIADHIIRQGEINESLLGLIKDMDKRLKELEQKKK